MPNSYSIFTGQVVESSSKADLFGLLEFLPDNTQKLIRPRDVRDAFLTTWANSTFKLTSTSGDTQYIGIDTGNPNDKDVKAKMLLGKRSVGSFDIMSESLLNTSDTDVFFYNTKPDDADQNKTKVSLLAGTSRNLYVNSPYLESEKVDGESIIDFNIINPSPGGSLNISSNDDVVNINGISFPTIQETLDNVGEDKILKYVGTFPFGGLEWSELDTSDFNIGSTGSETNIYGDPVNLNGFSLEFVEDDIVPLDIGGVKQGDTFEANSMDQNGNYTSANDGQNWALGEVLRKVIYPEVVPELTLKVAAPGNIKYVEVGKPTTLSFSYSIKSFPRKDDEVVAKWFLRNNADSETTWNIIADGGPLSNNPGDVFNGSVNYNIPGNITTPRTLEFELLASNNNDITLVPSSSLFGFNFRIKDSIEYVRPILHSFIDINHLLSGGALNNIINSSNTGKIIKAIPNIGETLDFTINSGGGYIYFAQPISYPEVSKIKDTNGFVIYDKNQSGLSSFEVSNSITPSSPNNFLGGYRLYKSKLRVTVDGSFKIEIIY